MPMIDLSAADIRHLTKLVQNNIKKEERQRAKKPPYTEGRDAGAFKLKKLRELEDKLAGSIGEL
jgi:hypothetical protein